MSSRAEILKKVQAFAAQNNEEEYNLPVAGADPAHEARLDQTIRELNSRIDEQRKALEQLKASVSDPNFPYEVAPSPPQQLRQLQIQQAAYTALNEDEPILPLPSSAATSVLPSLLALRATSRTNAETRSAIAELHEDLKQTRNRLGAEETAAETGEELSILLAERIETLRDEVREKSRRTPKEAARALIESSTSKASAHDTARQALIRALRRFINQTLAPLLAAEELGGPVAGTRHDITDSMLAAGFTAQGKPKKQLASAGGGTNASGGDSLKRQQRIDRIWGAQEASPGGGGGAARRKRGGRGSVGADDEFAAAPRTEAQAAAKEMRKLVEKLLNASAEGGSRGWVYVDEQAALVGKGSLGQEDDEGAEEEGEKVVVRGGAALRFLVRSEVVVVDERRGRVRLVDFGREADD